jgi:hypothetical protein
MVGFRVSCRTACKRIMNVRWQVEPAFTLVSCSAYSSTLEMETICPPKLRLTFNGLYDVISYHLIVLFVNAVFIQYNVKYRFGVIS